MDFVAFGNAEVGKSITSGNRYNLGSAVFEDSTGK